MQIDFTVDTDKMREEGADAVNIMFNKGVANYCRGGVMGIVSSLFLDLDLNSDIETYVLDEKLVEEIHEFITEHKDAIVNQINNISEEKGYDLDGDLIMAKTIDNTLHKRKRYGMYVTFETVIV